MKKYFYVFILIAIVLILPACVGKESKEDVIDQVDEKADEVEKYYTDLNLTVKTSNATGQVINESESNLKVNLNEKTLESSGERIQNNQKLKYYSTKDATYAKTNNGNWQNITNQEENFRKTKSFYPNIAKILTDLKDSEDVEMEEKDDKFIFTFKGKSEEVFKAFEYPYSLTVTGVNKEDVEHDFKMIVDRDTYYIDEVKNKVRAEKEGSELIIRIDQTYDKINAIDPIKIPQKVKDEVNSR